MTSMINCLSSLNNFSEPSHCYHEVSDCLTMWSGGNILDFSYVPASVPKGRIATIDSSSSIDPVCCTSRAVSSRDLLLWLKNQTSCQSFVASDSHVEGNPPPGGVGAGGGWRGGGGGGCYRVVFCRGGGGGGMDIEEVIIVIHGGRSKHAVVDR